jgi:hypothetical protein
LVTPDGKTTEPAEAAIFGKISAHSLATGPVIAVPFNSPFYPPIIIPALSSK